MKSNKVIYENAQWKLEAGENGWIFVEKSDNSYHEYWCYVSEIMANANLFHHVSGKTWCDVDLWSDVCRKAAELSPYKPKYDLGEKTKLAQKLKDQDRRSQKESLEVARLKGTRLLKPSEICD